MVLEIFRSCSKPEILERHPLSYERMALRVVGRDFADANDLFTLSVGHNVRLFMIQHDCGHGAFFSDRRANDWIGRIIGVITLTPYDLWRRTHAIHHATSGNLDRRGIGDVDTLTVRE